MDRNEERMVSDITVDTMARWARHEANRCRALADLSDQKGDHEKAERWRYNERIALATAERLFVHLVHEVIEH
jgi:hypothetical protein